jgi:hypothetical protein
MDWVMARVLEAAHFDAVHVLRDAKLLRLAVLKDDLAAIVADWSGTGQTFDLALSPGDAPAPVDRPHNRGRDGADPKTYRLVEDTHGSREILLESADRAMWWTG